MPTGVCLIELEGVGICGSVRVAHQDPFKGQGATRVLLQLLTLEGKIRSAASAGV